MRSPRYLIYITVLSFMQWSLGAIWPITGSTFLVPKLADATYAHSFTMQTLSIHVYCTCILNFFTSLVLPLKWNNRKFKAKYTNLPEAFLTFASKSSVGPSYTANGQEDNETCTNLKDDTNMLNLTLNCWILTRTRPRNSYKLKKGPPTGGALIDHIQWSFFSA